MSDLLFLFSAMKDEILIFFNTFPCICVMGSHGMWKVQEFTSTLRCFAYKGSEIILNLLGLTVSL